MSPARRPLLVPVVALLLAAVPLVAAPPSSLVVCAPGYPGNTAAAQPTMDALAAGVAEAAGWSGERLRAEYHPTLDGGLERLRAEDAALALVGLPFFLEYRDALGLRPMLQVATQVGETERYALVAKKGTVTGPESLDGWQVDGLHGFSPAFVRRVLLADWGRLPEGAEVRFTSRIVSSLRKAAAGEPVAVLLDPAQADALSGLPFAADLEEVTRTAPVAASLLCRVGERLSDADVAVLSPALLKLHATEEGRALLESIRMRRFLPLDEAALARTERAFGAAAAGAP